jgi:hypothetical protein
MYMDLYAVLAICTYFILFPLVCWQNVSVTSVFLFEHSKAVLPAVMLVCILGAGIHHVWF